MIQVLIIIAASVFLLLGMLHGGLTLRDLKNPRFFTPPDLELRRAMQKSSVRLHRDINLWKAWLGFNLTHSLGLIFFGAVFLHVGIFEPANFAASQLFQIVAVSVSAIYVLVSLKYFFSRPAMYSAAGLICFLVAAVLSHV